MTHVKIKLPYLSFCTQLGLSSHFQFWLLASLLAFSLVDWEFMYFGTGVLQDPFPQEC